MKMTTAAYAAVAALLLAPACRAQTILKPGGSLWIEGDSTLHRWSSTSTAVGLSLTFAEGTTDPAAALKAASVKAAEAHVPVASLSSGEKGLDKNMTKAMKAGEFPEVLYKLATYQPLKTGEGGVMKAETSGELTIAGVSKTVAIPMEFAPGPDGLRVRGSCALKMSEYGIAPPKLFLGTIKVRDEVTVRFDLILNAQKEKLP